MQVLIVLIEKLLPLYLTILVGYFSTRLVKIDKVGLSAFLVKVVLPIVVFVAAINAEVNSQLFYLPFVSYGLVAVICFMMFFLGRYFLNNNSNYILSVGIANGNFGFLGIPLTLILVGEAGMPAAAIYNLIGAIFISTLGLFLIYKSEYSLKESMRKLFKIPIIYAFLLGISLNILGVNIESSALSDFLNKFSSAYTIMGLFLIGIVISELKLRHLNLKQIIFVGFGSFVVWPLITLLFIYFDTYFFGLFDAITHKTMLVMSIVPVGASIVALAGETKEYIDDAAAAVLSSMVIAVFFIPFVGVTMLS